MDTVGAGSERVAQPSLSFLSCPGFERVGTCKEEGLRDIVGKQKRLISIENIT